MADHVKLYFEIPIEDTEESEIETVWARPCEKDYKLDNIPFYAKGVALGDVVAAKSIDDCLYVEKLLKPSGHSTIRIWFSDANDVQSTRNFLNVMGCRSEISDQPCLIAVDVPPLVAYEKVQAFLDEGEANNKWDYQEACLGFL